MEAAKHLLEYLIDMCMESSEDCRSCRFLRPSNNVWDDREATLLFELYCLLKCTTPEVLNSHLGRQATWVTLRGYDVANEK